MLPIMLAAMTLPPGWAAVPGEPGVYQRGTVTAQAMPVSPDASAREALSAARGPAARLPECAGLSDPGLSVTESDGSVAYWVLGDAVACILIATDEVGDGRAGAVVLIAEDPLADGGAALIGASDGIVEILLASREGGQNVPAQQRAASIDSPTPPAPAPVRSAASLAEAAAMVPAANKPEGAVIIGEGGFVGWPATFVYEAYPVFLFAGGKATDCDANPVTLDWNALARDDDCTVYQWRKRGGSIELKGPDEGWDEHEPEGTMAMGQDARLSVRFENRGGVSFDYGVGMPVHTLTGKNLIMERGGRIVLSGYSSTLASGSGASVYAGSNPPPVAGTYRLDGHLLTILPDGSDTPLHGYVAVVEGDETGRPGHVFLGGVQYYDPDD